MENGMRMTFEECMPETFQKQIAGVLDSHVRTSPLQENKLDFKEAVQACFSELCTLLDSSKKKINPLTFSLRTLKICLVLMEDVIAAIGVEPLYGNRSGKQGKTHWMAFIKTEEV